MTEIYDYLRLLYARCGTPHCPNCGRAVARQTPGQIADIVLSWPEGERIEVLAPLVRGRKGEFRDLFESARRQGFVRAYVDGDVIELADPPVLNRRQNHDVSVVVDRLVVRLEDRPRLVDSIETATRLADGLVQVRRQGPKEEAALFSEKYGCPDCGISLPELEPRQFSFNSPFGACPVCAGLGTRREVSPSLILGDRTISILEGVILPWGEPDGYLRRVILPALAKQFKFDPAKPWGELPAKVQDVLLHGAVAKKGEAKWEGILSNVQRRYEETSSDGVRMELEAFMVVAPCPACKGFRLKPETLAVTIADRNIGEFVAMPVHEALAAAASIPLRAPGKPGLEPDVAGPILKEVSDRLRFLNEVGLDYLTLSRSAESLSGGEAQRIRLATQIGSRLVGVLYILDEPSIGLHQRDNRRLLNTLEQLRDLGNTVLVVEHDEETIRAADYVIDLGPGAGKHGGNVIAAGSVDDVIATSASITGRYLRGDAQIDVPKQRRARDSRALKITGAVEHNLRDLTVEIPLGMFVAVTGVSGSGKSTLIEDILHRSLARHFYRARVIPGRHKSLTGIEHLDKVIDIDQSAIGRTPRSNPATYTGLFAPIRDLFSDMSEAQLRGYGPGRFSFNVKGGRCEACEGDGLVKIEMHFLPDVYVPCDVCKGRRYNRETLEIRFRGLSIADVLDLTVEDALTFFENQPRIAQKLKTLNDVGLGYIHLGQSATTLSGGEAQRVKLATELSKRDTGRTLYILDEPTTGLHFEDVRMLLHVLHRLVDRGNSILVIEHNLDVIKTADWILDLGPEGGVRGGTIVAEGTPEQVSRMGASHTGRYLKDVLGAKRSSSSSS